MHVFTEISEYCSASIFVFKLEALTGPVYHTDRLLEALTSPVYHTGRLMEALTGPVYHTGRLLEALTGPVYHRGRLMEALTGPVYHTGRLLEALTGPVYHTGRLQTLQVSRIDQTSQPFSVTPFSLLCSKKPILVPIPCQIIPFRSYSLFSEQEYQFIYLSN